MPHKKKDQIKLICDVGELCGLFYGTASLEDFLQKVVKMVATHMKSNVCSIYLYYADEQKLVLKATTGLNPDLIDNVSLKLNEGLTGLALQQQQPICERHASQNKNFRYFPGLGEEAYESFLAVPILRGHHKIGVIVIQNTNKDYFDNDDIRALKAITAQLANTIETTQYFLSADEQRAPLSTYFDEDKLKFLKGKAASSGIALAPTTVFSDTVSLTDYQGERKKNFTISDFRRAVALSEKQLNQIQQQLDEHLSDVASLIFSAQILMLKDKHFIDAIAAKIKKGAAPLKAVSFSVMQYAAKFSALSDEYLRERSHDVLDIGKRILANLTGRKQNILSYEKHIVIAPELYPSDILKLYSQKVQGIIVLSGGVTSHLSILSRSLGIPLIIIDEPRLLTVPAQTKILMDADQGNIYVNPARNIIESFKEQQTLLRKSQEQKRRVKTKTATKDGTRICLMANINLLGDLKSANEFKAEGVGLYRTEFPFIVRNNFPSEEEQFVIYKKLIAGMPKKEITFRTLDIGGDKLLAYFDHHAKESNPFLGLRSIRFSLRHQDIFMPQIRAILRAGAKKDIRIMFPMISSIDEFLAAKNILYSEIKNLKKEKTAYNEQPLIGLMIELPAVLEMLDELAQEADFFSIGTNDFVQYMLAVDRTNEKIADLYVPHHPSVLRGLKKVVATANKHKIGVSICGDMVHDQRYLGFLLGIGLRRFSLNPDYIPRIQKAISKINVADAQEEARNLLKMTRLKDTQAFYQ